MEVFRITQAAYTDHLYASGKPARWNSAGQKVIYTASSRSLACLENVVHRNNKGLNALFKVMVIYVPDALFITSIHPDVLPEGWYESTEVVACKNAGDAWLQQSQSAVLRVPSAIVPNEYNFLLNPLHIGFEQIKIIATESFRFDKRIKDKM